MEISIQQASTVMTTDELLRCTNGNPTGFIIREAGFLSCIWVIVGVRPNGDLKVMSLSGVRLLPEEPTYFKKGSAICVLGKGSHTKLKTRQAKRWKTIASIYPEIERREI